MDHELANTIWCEKYRSYSVDDLIVPNRVLRTIKGALSRPDSFPNFLFYSQNAGVFKTTAAMAIAHYMEDEYESRYKKINASKDASKDTIKEDIEQWSKYSSIEGHPNIIVLDEIDKSHSTIFTDALLGTIESIYQSTRFIMTANNLVDFSKYSKSRVTIIDFTPSDKDEKKEVKYKMFLRLKYICENENVEYSEKVLQEIINNNFPDMRTMMYKLYNLFITNGDLKTYSDIKSKSDITYDDIVQCLLNANYDSARVAYNNKPSNVDIFLSLMNSLSAEVKDVKKRLYIIKTIRDHMITHETAIDKEVNISSMLACICMIIGGL